MHIHILGIAGGLSSSLALALVRQGHHVSGSDQDKIYPPFSTRLHKAKIPFNTTPITPQIDLAIIGASYNFFARTQSEFKDIKKLKINWISATNYLSRHVAKKNSILIAGTYGKSTISALVSWILYCCHIDPSYMFGAEPINRFAPLSLSDSDWSVLEADESINGLDRRAKFLYYPVKYLLLTSAEWEHRESYPTAKDNFTAFKKLTTRVPKNGLMVINTQGTDTRQLARFSRSPVITYGPEGDYQILSVQVQKLTTKLKVRTPSGNLTVTTPLIGAFNHQNVLAALTLSLELGLDPVQVKKAIRSFKGIKRRLELIDNHQDTYFFDDFAQSPTRVKSALKALSCHFPNRRLVVFFEPHASSLQTKNALTGFKQAFAPADRVVLARIPFKPNVDRSLRVSAKDYQAEIGSKLIYQPLTEELITYLSATIRPGDIVVHFSSGGLDGLKSLKKVIKTYRHTVSSRIRN